MKTSVLNIALVCHETNRALQSIHGDPAPSPPWEKAPRWQVEASIASVEEVLAGATPEQLHERWCDLKAMEGWVHGPVKDPEAKTHPALVPYAELPDDQLQRDAVFVAVVRAMSGAQVTGPKGVESAVITDLTTKITDRRAVAVRPLDPASSDVFDVIEARAGEAASVLEAVKPTSSEAGWVLVIASLFEAANQLRQTASRCGDPQPLLDTADELDKFAERATALAEDATGRRTR
ncbi:RyR domain-containing protein [Actinosynnema sp. NPDC051121]